MRISLRLASIDIGTNSTRLLVAECDGDKIETIDRRMVITRLGERVDKTRLLAPEAMERTLAALAGYRDVMSPLEPVGVSAIATSAVRDCANSAEFLDLAEEAIGGRPRILPGDEEARLSFTGAISDIGGEMDGEGPVLVFDIGGGSTELMVGDPLPQTPSPHGLEGRFSTCPEPEQESPSPLGGEGRGGGEITTVRSVDVGCVRMSERFLGNDPPSPVSVGRMESHILTRIKPVMDNILPERPSLGIGLAGTVTTVSAVKQGLPEYRTDRIHHSRLSRRDVEDVFKKLASVPLEERKQVMGLEPGRADVIVGGIAVLRVVMDLAHLDEILVSEKDILDGLVIDLYREIAEQ